MHHHQFRNSIQNNFHPRALALVMEMMGFLVLASTVAAKEMTQEVHLAGNFIASTGCSLLMAPINLRWTLSNCQVPVLASPPPILSQNSEALGRDKDDTLQNKLSHEISMYDLNLHSR